VVADDEAVAAKLPEAAAVSIDWAARNAVAFGRPREDRGGDLPEGKGAPAAAVKVGANTLPFSKEATRWLGAWLDSQLTLNDHHTIRLKSVKNAIARLRRLADMAAWTWRHAFS